MVKKTFFGGESGKKNNINLKFNGKNNIQKVIDMRFQEYIQYLEL